MLHLIVENILLVVTLHSWCADIGHGAHIRLVLRNEKGALWTNPWHLTAFMGRRVVLLNDFENLVASLLVRYRVHGLDFSAAARVLGVTVQAPLGRVIVRSAGENPSGRASALRISEGLVSFSCLRWVTLKAIVHATDLDDRR